jgi:hypothetical protein
MLTLVINGQSQGMLAQSRYLKVTPRTMVCYINVGWDGPRLPEVP